MIRTRLLVLLGVAVLLCLVGFAGRTAMSAPIPAIKWEYKMVSIWDDEKTIQEELNKAGADGWELAGLLNTGQLPSPRRVGGAAAGNYAILKRQR